MTEPVDDKEIDLLVPSQIQGRLIGEVKNDRKPGGAVIKNAVDYCERDRFFNEDAAERLAPID